MHTGLINAEPQQWAESVMAAAHANYLLALPPYSTFAYRHVSAPSLDKDPEYQPAHSAWWKKDLP